MDPQASNQGAVDDEDTLSEFSNYEDDQVIRAELPEKWILTLSMRFRDGTKSEKFFVTYLRKPNDWLRVSISVDYEKADDGSLERDLKSLAYQRDKNFYIYRAVHQSLDEIGWYNTVTNLRLKTVDGQLQIHVTEDFDEPIPYPPLKVFGNIDFQLHGYLLVREDAVHFESHLSGSMYKVKANDRVYVKREIISTQTVLQVIYEIVALAALRKSSSVVNLVGLVLDDDDYVTGILTEWASGGAISDFFYDIGDDKLDWNTRLTWIRQVVQGMADIHESGFVQGGCTLSKVVLDSTGAKIADINHRGCRTGWEPPEFVDMIKTGQCISIYIGVKSDLYQMGMVLWAIAMQVEEPETADRPFALDDPTMPMKLVNVITSCLSKEPDLRHSAKDLLLMLSEEDTLPT